MVNYLLIVHIIGVEKLFVRRSAHCNDLLDREVERQLVFLPDDSHFQRRLPVAHFEQVLAVKEYAPRVRPERTVYIFQNGGFSRAVGSYKTYKLPFFHAE